MKGAIVSAPEGDNGGRRLTPEEAKGRRSRNIAIALGIVFLIVLFYVVTIVKLGPGIVVRPSI
jgi:hypothetical protein